MPRAALEPTVDLAAHGPYKVGATSFLVDGPDGLGLPTEVWYPAVEREGAPYAYLPGLARAALSGVSPCGAQPRPVAVFSHGHTAVRFQSITLAEHLASHGFVVAAPDHVGNTFSDTVLEQLGFVAMRRPLDLAAVFDAVVAHPQLGRCVDPVTGYAAVGHSFGGWTALLAAGARVDRQHLAEHGDGRHFLTSLLDIGTERFLGRPDPRVWAAVAMAPTGYPSLGPEGLAHLTAPLLVLGGDEDENTPWGDHQAPLLDHVRSPLAYAACLLGASHYTFSDAGRLVPIDPYTRGSLSLDEAHPLIGGLTVAFLLRALGVDGGLADPWLPLEHPHVRWRAP